MNRLTFWIVTLGFDLYWALAVLLRDRLNIPLAAVAVLVWLPSPAPLRIPLLAMALAGVLMDSLWLWLELFEFTAASRFPLWMLALWLTWACWWGQVIQRFSLHPALLAVTGAFCGPFAYFIGARSGAMVLTKDPLWVFTLLAVGWAGLLLLSHWLLARKT